MDFKDLDLPERIITMVTKGSWEDVQIALLVLGEADEKVLLHGLEEYRWVYHYNRNLGGHLDTCVVTKRGVEIRVGTVAIWLIKN